MHWDIYTITSVVSGVLCVAGAFVPDVATKNTHRLWLLIGGVFSIGYGIHVAKQTTGIYDFPVQIFFIPVIAIGYIGYKIFAPTDVVPRNPLTTAPTHATRTVPARAPSATPLQVRGRGSGLPRASLDSLLKRIRIDLKGLSTGHSNQIALTVRESELDLGIQPWSAVKSAIAKELESGRLAAADVIETGPPGDRSIRMTIGRRDSGPDVSELLVEPVPVHASLSGKALPAHAVRKRVALDVRRNLNSADDFAVSISEVDVEGAPTSWSGSLAAARETIENAGFFVRNVNISGPEGRRLASFAVGRQLSPALDG
jgi:hypothetical protein